MQLFIIISRLQAWFGSLLHKASEPAPKYVDLAPTDNADEDGIYADALLYATSNKNVSNIALTGPYGSGKSSIIKAFLKKYKKKTLQISLAAFLPEADGSVTTDNDKLSQKGTVSKQEIERSILQQMLYGADANKLPLSRFKRIQSKNWSSSLVSLYIILGIIALWFLLQNSSIILTGDFFVKNNDINFFNFIVFGYGFVFLWISFHQLYIKSLGVSLKSISLKDIEITPAAAKEESILNRHLDEIIYFFQCTKYELVIIEDLDRFNNPDIFVTLREINSLVNANAGVNRQIRFLYALRDNMFANTDRTKFFEFIIPVIPIINSSNSIDKVIEQGRRLSIDKRLNIQFLREVSRYLNDLRLIQNVYNEYTIYVANLETDGENILDANKLLAVLIYKNILPSDFEELHSGKGKFFKILNQRDDYISKLEKYNKDKIADIEYQISIAEKQTPSDFDELRKIYAMSLIDKIPQGVTAIDFKDTRNIPIQNIWNNDFFEDIIESSEIYYRNSYNRQPIDIRSLQSEIDSDKTYQERKAEIEKKSVTSKEMALKNIQELRATNASLRIKKFSEIIRANVNETEKLFEAFEENSDLLRFLVFEGFLDDTYYQYTSLFHSSSGRLSPNDNKFLIQIRSFNNPEPDFQIDNPKEVIAAMRIDDFSQRFVLNTTIIDCLLREPNAYNKQITMFVTFISAHFKDCEEFFQSYYNRGKYTAALLSTLNNSWPDFVTSAISSEDCVNHVAHVIAYLPESHLATLCEKNPKLSEFLSTRLFEILSLGIDFEPSRLNNFIFEIKDFTTMRPYPAIRRVLFDDDKYEITKNNISYIVNEILGHDAVKDLNIKNYTTILNLDDYKLFDKIEENFEFYMKRVILTLDNNTEEELSAIIRVINHDEIKIEYLSEFIDKQSAIIPLLEEVPTRLHSIVFQLRKIKATWENCAEYTVSELYNADTLTEYLQHQEIQSCLAGSIINDQPPAQRLRQFLVSNNHLEDNTYRTYLRALPKQFTDFPKGLSIEKMQILIDEKKIVFSDANFAALEDDENLKVFYIAKNIDKYLTDPDKFMLDDAFLEKLLTSAITDSQKLRIVERMNLSTLSDLPRRALIVGQLFHRTNIDPSHMDDEIIQALVLYSKPVSVQISLFNTCQMILSLDRIRSIIQNLPAPFNAIQPGWGRPTIPKTAENIKFAEWLESRSLISSYTISLLKGEIRINNRRK